MGQLTCVSKETGADPIGGAAQLLPLVYDELRRLAAARLAGEFDPLTMDPTALVHEAWLRLANSRSQHWQSPGHFFAAAAEAMRRILIDSARRKRAAKRGGLLTKVDLEVTDVVAENNEVSRLGVKEALEGLRSVAPACAELIDLRFFTGLNYQEAAKTLGVSQRTAKRYWTFGRAWLCEQLANPSRPM